MRRRGFCVTVLLCLLLLAGCRAPMRDGLRISVLDAGQSDCILLSCDGVHMLIDTGTAAERYRVEGALEELDVACLQHVVVTHPHEDHYGNARFLLETYPVDTLMISDSPCEELGYRLMLETAERVGTELKKGTDGATFTLGCATVEVFCPLPEDENTNNASLVLRVRYAGQTLLFMGDAEQEAEEALLARWGEDADCDFLKVGHHGSDTASSTAFLQATTPAIAAISCGRDNEFGFPQAAVAEGLAAVGAEIFRTDECGTLTFICNTEGIVYEK